MDYVHTHNNWNRHKDRIHYCHGTLSLMHMTGKLRLKYEILYFGAA